MLTNVVNTWSRWEILMPVGLGLLSTIFWRVPILKLFFEPFLLFNTYIHELCHGFITLLTGGAFKYMRVDQTKAGIAVRQGGNTALVATAGYLGSVLASGLFIQLPTTRMPAPLALIWIGITLLVLCVLFVRNLFGLAIIVIAVTLTYRYR